MIKNKNRKLKGFTLMELSLLMALVGIIAAISFATLGGVKDESRVNNACNIAASTINKARNYALTGKKVGSSVPASFSFEASGNEMSIKGDDDGTVVETVKLPADISSDLSCTFTVPNGDGTCLNEERYFKKSDGGNSAKKVSISGNGRFAVCK